MPAPREQKLGSIAGGVTGRRKRVALIVLLAAALLASLAMVFRFAASEPEADWTLVVAFALCAAALGSRLAWAVLPDRSDSDAR